MVKPTVCQLRRDSNRVVHLVRADEAKPALVEALKLNANLNLLARSARLMRSSPPMCEGPLTKHGHPKPGKSGRPAIRPTEPIPMDIWNDGCGA